MDDDIRIEKNSNGIETYIFDPYNPVNIPITEDDIKGILKRYGINIPIFNYFGNHPYSKSSTLWS